jgi:uncharacterized protein YkwD
VTVVRPGASTAVLRWRCREGQRIRISAVFVPPLRHATGRPRTVPRQRPAATLALAAAALLVGAAAIADTVGAVNRGRSATCGRAASLVPLRETRELDGAARALAHGATLHAALATLSLRPEFATALHLAGAGDDRGVAEAVSRHGCGDLGRPELRELGIAWSGQSLYLVAAVPLQVPAPADRARVEREILARINAARAAPRRCGTTEFPAVAPLALSRQLSQIAAGHSATMSASDNLAHQDPDGSTPADRVRRGGYDARIVGENVASGVPTATEVVAGWLASPGHCANIMDARFTEMGIAYVVAPRSGGAIYWTQLFAAHRS